MMRVRFWGTRGSLAKPGLTTLRYGGNTACVEVRTSDGTLIVLDCGTGAHGLGEALLASGQRPRHGYLLITHTHWDHIQGFPFFSPLFVAGTEWDIYAPGGFGEHLENTLAGQMQYRYFPVTLAQLGATIRFHDLVEGSFTLGGVRVVAQYQNHPALALGYRLEAGGAAVVYATDHEPYGRDHPDGPWLSEMPGAPAPHPEDRRHVAFLAGADLVIHDAQFTAEEYPSRVGWGHTPVEWAVDYAVAAGARRLALFHHDPSRSDDALDRMVEACRRRVSAAGSGLDVFAAAEGQVLELAARDGRAPAASPLGAGEATSLPARAPGQAHTVLIVDDDPEIVRLLTSTLAMDGFRILTAGDGLTALRLARAERPSLLILDWRMPGLEGIEVARRLRADPDPFFREVPVVLITAQKGSAMAAQGFAAGVTDYLTKPIKPALIRARVRAWLLRRGKGDGGGA
jgi:CheY-like chemotaxis protein/phosphoribosyl 1,2-cyclic phosphodiesterase